MCYTSQIDFQLTAHMQAPQKRTVIKDLQMQTADRNENKTIVQSKLTERRLWVVQKSNLPISKDSIDASHHVRVLESSSVEDVSSPSVVMTLWEIYV